MKDAIQRIVRGGSRRTVVGVCKHTFPSLVEGFWWGEAAQQELQCSAKNISASLVFHVRPKSYPVCICVSPLMTFELIY